MVVLPDLRGPVTSTIPFGLEIAFLKRSSECGSKPSLVMSSMSFDLSSSRRTIFSPHRVGSTDTRKSRSRLRSSTFILILMRPSWGSRFSRDVQPGHDLDAGDERVPQLQGQRHHVVEDPVDAEADAELLLVGLDVDVGGAPLERVHEQHVRQLDDGRGVGGLREVAEVDLVVLGLDRLGVGIGVAHRVEVDLGEAADRGHVVDAEGRAVRDLLGGRPRRRAGFRGRPRRARRPAAAPASGSIRSSGRSRPRAPTRRPRPAPRCSRS